MCGPWGKWGHLGERGGGGPGPPCGEQDKQLVCNSGGDETHGGTRRTAKWVRCNIKNSSRTEYVICEVVTVALFVYSNNNCVNVI